MSVSLYRTLKNVWESGLKRAGRQIATHNDTKSGVLVGTDKYGNKFYETHDEAEIHMRTRWVEYREFWRFDLSQVEPGWHYWLAYGSDTPPSALSEKDKIENIYAVPQPKVNTPNLTFTKGAYIPYNTAKPKVDTWAPTISERTH